MCDASGPLERCCNLFAGYVRFWLSAGRGGFGLSPLECESPTFYCMAYSTDGTRPDVTKGWKVPLPKDTPSASSHHIVHHACVGIV